MKTNMKQNSNSKRWNRIIALPTAILLFAGCGGDGGGSGDSGTPSGGSGPGSGNPPGPQPVVASVQVGLPACSTTGTGAVDGRLFPGNTSYVNVTPTCSTSNSYMRVWLQVNITGATVDHYDWRIIGWRNQTPHGGLAYYDRVVDIDLTAGRYVVQSSGNRIRYDSARQ